MYNYMCVYIYIYICIYTHCNHKYMSFNIVSTKRALPGGFPVQSFPLFRDVLERWNDSIQRSRFARS